MHKLAIIFLLLILPTIVVAETFENIKVEDSVEDQYWNITLLSMDSDNSILMQVWLDPSELITKRVYFNTTTNFDGINITTTETFFDEDPLLTLITFQTDVLWSHDCEVDSDCNDDGACTIDKCIGYPKSCDYDNSHTNITVCTTGDGCCPSDCRWRDDKDCVQFPCDSRFDCNDYNASTNDSCAANYSCDFREIVWCETDDEICPVNCTYTSEITSARDLDCSKDNVCIKHEDCDDNNASTADLCYADPSTDPKTCVYETITLRPTLEDYDLPTQPVDTKQYEYNEPPEANEGVIKGLLTHGDRKRNLAILFGILLAGLVVYVVWISLKFKPEPKVYGSIQ